MKASDRQLGLIINLARKIGVEGTLEEVEIQICAEHGLESIELLTAQEASRLIDTLTDQLKGEIKDPDAPATDKQKSFLFALARKTNLHFQTIDDDKLIKVLQDRFSIRVSDKMTKKEAKEGIELMQKRVKWLRGRLGTNRLDGVESVE